MSMIRQITGRIQPYAAAAWCFCVTLLSSTPSLATQGHAGIEGVWVHQFAHLFFLFSMMLLIYWLRQAGLVKAPG